MKNKLDKFLLALLWTLACSLTACFWFYMRFGFNIFLSAHWQHLARMQANQTNVTPSFYISMVVFVLAYLIILHILVRPARRRTHHRAVTHTPNSTNQPVARTTPKPTDMQSQSAAISRPAPLSSPTPPAPVVTGPTVATPPVADIEIPSRPPRLNLPGGTNVPAPVATAPVPTVVSTPRQTTNDLSYSELDEIFKSAGYMTKPTLRISGVPISLLAIGTDEVLWIGARDVAPASLQSAIDALNQVFADTLDDIFITVHGFVISGDTSATSDASDVLVFRTPGELRAYISEHSNTPPSDDDENFAAYSSYISTVIDYLRKVS